MNPTRWATEVKKENFQAIISECGQNFDLAYLEMWIDRYASDPGYFVRSPDDPFDCCLVATDHFERLYAFRYPDTGALFRRIIQINTGGQQ